MKLYVMRHGETIPNILHLISGKKECDLTYKGIIQAEKAGQQLKNIEFDAILVSPLSRARITACHIGKSPMIIDKRLIERDYGTFEFKKKSEVPYDEFWNYYLNYNECKGENIISLLNRTKSLIKSLLDKYPNKTVLLITHSGIARAIHYNIEGIPRDGDLTKLEIPNCSFRVYDIKEN